MYFYDTKIRINSIFAKQIKLKIMDTRWKTNSHTVYNLGYHIIWCVKYRKELLVGEIEERLKELLISKSNENGWDIESLEVMPDHVHLFIKSTPSDSVSHIVSQLKGYTANMLRKEFRILRSRLPTLWTRSFYCESVGHISESTIVKYIENQKNV